VLRHRPLLLRLLPLHLLLPLRLLRQPSLAPKFTPALPCVNWPASSASN